MKAHSQMSYYVRFVTLNKLNIRKVKFPVIKKTTDGLQCLEKHLQTGESCERCSHFSTLKRLNYLKWMPAFSLTLQHPL